jgi:hypothetical protein
VEALLVVLALPKRLSDPVGHVDRDLYALHNRYRWWRCPRRCSKAPKDWATDSRKAAVPQPLSRKFTCRETFDTSAGAENRGPRRQEHLFTSTLSVL